MSIECITGVPGAGKTYLAAKIVKEAYDSKKRLIYTNINLHVSYDDYLKILDVDTLYKFAKSEYKLYSHFEKLSTEYEENHNDNDVLSLKDDSSLIINEFEDSDVIEDEKREFNIDDVSDYIGNYDKYLHDSGLLKDIEGALIVWDECQNRLQGDGVSSKADPIWIRFFSYHRHFNIDIILVTQDISLIHRRYKPFISKYYFGQNPAKRLFTTTLKFKVYTDYREFEKFYIETINIPMKKEIHDFYDSGEYNPSKSVFLKKIFPAIALILVASLFFYFMFEKKVDKSKVSVPVVKSIKKDNNVSTNKQNDSDAFEYDESNHIIFFTCNLDNCVLKNSSFVVPLDAMNNLSNAIGMTILYTTSINRYYNLVAVSVSDTLFNDLMRFNIQTKGDKHEKGRMDFSHSARKF